jgi:phosphoserine aminotransferase
VRGVTRDVVNFNAGPAGLPRPALERARAELLDFEGTGMSILEHSHRGKAYEAVHQAAKDGLRRVMGVPDTHEILFVQGGASQLFATVPMNFLPPGRSADYVTTGVWSQKALEEARRIGAAREAGTGLVNGRFVHIPSQAELSLDPAAAYVHYTTNNTVAGTQWHRIPDVGAVPLVADQSSDILSRRLDVSRFSLIYAGAQKNVGPSGLVVVIVRRGWLDEASTSIPVIFRMKTHADNDSLYNTPPTFSIYLVRNVLDWLEGEGGLDAIEARNDEKARRLYAAIDDSGGFYRCPVEREARSRMNVVFRLPSEPLEESFVKASTAAGLEGLKGHRSVGGLRASIYNAVGLEGVDRLVSFMADFAARNG